MYYGRRATLALSLTGMPRGTATHPVVSQGVMKYRVQLDIIRYIYTFQSTVESSSSQTECFSLPIHSDSCNMGLRLCDSSIIAEILRLTAAKLLLDGALRRSNLHETARKRPRARQLLDLTGGLWVPRPGRATLQLGQQSVMQ